MSVPTRSEAIADQLRDEILRGRYRVGERLPSERDLAERYGVHRGAVREAMKRLEQLGIVFIKPGGARVAPLESASVDVIEHLLRLESPPDPDLVDQVVEVASALFTTSARLCAERANETQRAGVRALVGELGRADLEGEERFELLEALGDVFVEASGNMVLKMIRRAVRAKIIDHLRPTAQRVMAIRPEPGPIGALQLDALLHAIEVRDGPAAAEAMHLVNRTMRERATEVIREARKAAGVEGPVDPKPGRFRIGHADQSALIATGNERSAGRRDDD